MKKIISILLLLALFIGGCSTQNSEISDANSQICESDTSSTSSQAEASDEVFTESSNDVSSQPSAEDSIPYDESSRSANDESDTVYECKLIVNGKDITEGSGVKMYRDRAELPFVAIMEALDLSFVWESDTVAYMYYRANKPFLLDIKKGELRWSAGDTEVNHFSAYSDSSLMYTAMKKEILIDDASFSALLNEFSMYFVIDYFDVDFENKEIRIGRDLKDYDCTLTVNGKNITKDSHAIMKRDDGHYFLLPFVAILEEFGAEFVWENDSVANVRFKEKVFTLDISKVELIAEEEGESYNLFLPSPGGVLHYAAYDREITIDNYTLHPLFNELGIVGKYNYEERTATLVLSEKSTDDSENIE